MYWSNWLSFDVVDGSWRFVKGRSKRWKEGGLSVRGFVDERFESWLSDLAQ
jgi:hypothetical protein